MLLRPPPIVFPSFQVLGRIFSSGPYILPWVDEEVLMIIEVLKVLLQRRLAARFGTAYRLAVGDVLLVTGGEGGVSGVSTSKGDRGRMGRDNKRHC